MSIENARIECPAKPSTHAFIHFKNEDGRNKYVRSANTLRKELRGRKLKITRSMDAEERSHQKRMGYVKNCIHMRHNIPLNSISMNWTSKHVSVKGQTVVKTCPKVDNLSISNIKTLILRSNIRRKNGSQKTHRNDCEQSRDGTKTQRYRKIQEATEA